MRAIARLIAPTALVVALAAPAYAGSTILTTPVLGAADGSRLLCIFSNLDKKPATVTLDIVDPLGSSTLATFDCGGPVAAGGACFVATGAANFKNGYCKVTTSTKKLKPVLWVQDAAGNVLSAVPATK